MFKATEVERETRETTLFIDMQINLSSCRTSDHYLSQSLQKFHVDSLGTKNVSSMLVQTFWKVNNSWQQIR